MDVGLLKAVESATKRTEKIALLQQADAVTQDLLRFAVDHSVTFGLYIDPTSLTLNDDASFPTLDYDGDASAGARIEDSMQASDWWTQYRDILHLLSTRKARGNAAKLLVLDHVYKAPSPEDVDWAIRIVDKELRAGISAKTVLRCFPGLFTPFVVPLAHPYKRTYSLQGVGYVEPKLDGVRLIVWNGDTLSREGNHLYGLQHVVRELATRIDLSKWVVDGEWVGDKLFEDTLSGERTDEIERAGHYHVFHLVRRSEWDAQKSRPLWAVKLDLRVKLSGLQITKIVPYYRVVNPTYNDMLKWRDRFLDQGFEGAMWKAANLPIQYGRTTAILKFKKRHPEDVVIVGTYPGDPGSKYEYMLGGIVVQLSDGTTTKCGMGFADWQRVDFWAKRDLLIGRTVEVTFQNKTKHGRLRFCNFEGLRHDKNAVDDEGDKDDG